MSRGPGRWQRAILAAVGEHGQVVLRQLVSAELGTRGEPPRAAMVAARRAANRLAEAGRIRLPWERVCRKCLYPQTANPYWCQNPRCSGKYIDLTHLMTVADLGRRGRLSVAQRRNAWQHIKAATG